jgi:hypothetical protein
MTQMRSWPGGRRNNLFAIPPRFVLPHIDALTVMKINLTENAQISPSAGFVRVSQGGCFGSFFI